MAQEQGKDNPNPTTKAEVLSQATRVDREFGVLDFVKTFTNFETYVWNSSGLHPLILAEPVHQGTHPQIIRQIYHRLLARIVSDRLHGYQTWCMWALFVWNVVLLALSFAITNPFDPRSGTAIKSLLGLIALVAPFAAIYLLVPILTKLARNKDDEEEVKGVISRCFLRTVSSDTPDDLRDPWRYGWTTSEGLPISSEITPSDAISDEARRRARMWRYVLRVAFVGGLFSFFGLVLNTVIPLFFSLLMVATLAMGRKLFDKRPMAERAEEMQSLAGVENAAFIASGGLAWTKLQESARVSQIEIALDDETPILHLGTATGILAGRGDFFAPTGGLPVDLSLQDLKTHLLVLGGTGSGKTSGILRPLAAQIAALADVGLVVMDGKGALPTELIGLERMQVIDPAKVKISLVGGLTPTQLADTISEILGGGSSSENRFFIESAAGLLRRAAVIAEVAGSDFWTLNGVMILAVQEEERKAAFLGIPDDAIRQNVLLQDALYYFDKEWKGMDPRTQTNILATLRSWISTIESHADLLAWSRTRPDEDTTDLAGPLKGKCLGFLLPAQRYGRGGAVATALLKSRIYAKIKDRADVGRMPSDTDVVFIIDEAQEVATEDDATMLAIGRSLGLAMVAATQTVEGIREKLGELSADKWLAIFGGVVAFPNRSRETDAFVTKRLGALWGPAVHEVPGVSVNQAIVSYALSGAHQAAERQRSLGAGIGQKNYDNPLMLNPAILLLGVLVKPDPMPDKSVLAAQSKIAPHDLVKSEEVMMLLSKPNTALVALTRARVPRRDVIEVDPKFTFDLSNT